MSPGVRIEAPGHVSLVAADGTDRLAFPWARADESRVLLAKPIDAERERAATPVWIAVAELLARGTHPGLGRFGFTGAASEHQHARRDKSEVDEARRHHLTRL